MRQHVNPLSRFFQLPINLPSPQKLFENPQKPIHLDIGCARGRFLLELAYLKQDWNYLGVEIRQPLVCAANKEKDDLGLTNLAFLFCNANVSLEAWLASLPIDLLQLVSIQFPDPWFKRKHHKRRVLQPGLLRHLAAAMAPGRELFIQSDLLSVINPMSSLIELSNCFEINSAFSNSILEPNPLKIPTERESYVISQGLPVYRKLYCRNSENAPEMNDLEKGFSDLITLK